MGGPTRGIPWLLDHSALVLFSSGFIDLFILFRLILFYLPGFICPVGRYFSVGSVAAP